MHENKEKTPKWLRRLEKESWQAELIISGLALYGSLQLPDIVYKLVDFLVSYLPIEQYFTGYMITYMMLLGISILSSFFIIHFVLRAYWVGLIGLNSVYPQGYSEDGDYFSPIYVRKITKILPTVKESIHKVDEICSTLFASAFLFLMMYGMLSILAAGFLLLHNFLLYYFSSRILIPVFYVVGAIISIYLVFGIFAGRKRFRDNEQIQHLYFLGAKYFGYLMSAFFFKPINQIMLTFYSNYKKGKTSFLTIAFLLIAVILSISHIANSNIRVLVKKGKAEASYFQKYRAYPEFYEENASDKNAIMNPIIPSEKLEGNLLKVFIPIFKNESFIQEVFCDSYENDETLSKELNKQLKAEQKSFCYPKYHQVFVNDSLYQAEFVRAEHPHMNEFGIVTYLPTDNFRKGKNELKTVKLETPEGKVYEEVTIPFWFAGE